MALEFKLYIKCIQGVPKKKEPFFEHLPQECALNISSKNLA